MPDLYGKHVHVLLEGGWVPRYRSVVMWFGHTWRCVARNGLGGRVGSACRSAAVPCYRCPATATLEAEGGGTTHRTHSLNSGGGGGGRAASAAAVGVCGGRGGFGRLLQSRPGLSARPLQVLISPLESVLHGSVVAW